MRLKNLSTLYREEITNPVINIIYLERNYYKMNVQIDQKVRQIRHFFMEAFNLDVRAMAQTLADKFNFD